MFHPLYLPGRPLIENTYSVMQNRYYFLSRTRLQNYPAVSIFDMEDETLTEAWWQSSYDGEENPNCHALHTCKQLRALVLTRFPEELYLLPTTERTLMRVLLWREGTLDHVSNSSDFPSLESLVRRMWCTFENGQDDGFRLYLPQELMLLARNILSSKEYQDFSIRLMTLESAIRAQLYLRGTLPMSEAFSLLDEMVLKPSKHTFDRTLALRYMKAAFHYLYDESGQLLLLHPGLINTAEQFPDLPPLPQNQEEFKLLVSSAAYNLLPEETPLYLRFCMLAEQELHNEEEAVNLVNDLRLLVKQNIPMTQVLEVLKARLLLPPSEPLLNCFKELYQFTPRWKTQTAALGQ